MNCKDEVSLDGLRRGIMDVIPLIDEIHLNHDGREATCTSSTGDKHSVARSAHYRGDAIDLRVWAWSDPQVFADRLKDKLGADYVVLNEKDHIHVHWSPLYSGE